MILVRRWFVLTALLLGTASPSKSTAFFDPPYITPTNPISGQEVSVNIYGGLCDPIFGLPGYPEILRDGNQITVTHYGGRYTDPELCFYPPGTETTLLGTFPPGSYDVEVRLYYINGYGEFQTDVIGTTSFVVTGAQAIAAPALSRLATLLLATSLLGLGAIALRTRSLAPSWLR